MQGAEIELKFRVEDVAGFRSAVDGLGFWLDTKRTFESNTLYDTPERSLRGRKQILRIRHYGPRCTLTHKRQDLIAKIPGRYKTRIETETEVSDGDALAEVFGQLGYVPMFRYEKYRTEWSRDGDGHLVLDETPIGVWAELEGPPEWIDAMLEGLGIASDACSTDSYGTLFLAWKDRTGSSVEHMTFAEIDADEALRCAGYVAAVG